MKCISLKFAIILCAVFFFARLGVGQTFDTCAHLFSWKYDQPQSASEAKEKYDTLRLYVERCAASDNKSYQVFPSLDGAAGLCAPNDTNRFKQYRDWLISVLYLNTSEPAYFCNCMSSIGGTFKYGKYNSIASALAVLDYIRHIPACYGKGLDREYTQDSLELHRSSLDTSIPSLDSLGLGFLLGHSGVSTYTLQPASKPRTNPSLILFNGSRKNGEIIHSFAYPFFRREVQKYLSPCRVSFIN